MPKLITQFKKAFSRLLPGVEAQYRMVHVIRPRPSKIPANAKESAILALFYPNNDNWSLALIQRNNDNPNDRHSGQISFPGGRRENTDKNLQETALREAEEEIGVIKEDIQILGALTDLYIPVSNFKVQGYVGVLPYTPDFIPNKSEVRTILQPTLKSLRDKNNIRHIDMEINPRITIKGVPYFAVDEHVVWGATAMMISEILVMLEAE